LRYLASDNNDSIRSMNTTMKKTYTYDEVRDASLVYFGGDTLAADVFAGKYALRDSDGAYLELTPFDMHRRLAQEFARIEARYPNPMSFDDILDLLAGHETGSDRRTMGDIVPQGSPMSAIGNEYQYQSLSNCFVIDGAHDSYAGILHTDQEQVQLMKRRGGVGHDLSKIRPKGLKTANAAGTTDGIGVFMERFSQSTREVAQGGRRGALMLTISCHHPEIRTFINIKKDKTKVTGANISVKLTDEFMQAVKDGTTVQLRFPVESDVPHVVEEFVDAKALWDEIIDAAHASAEPGLLFWDNVLKNGPADAYQKHKSVATNPCGEITLASYDSCRLLLLNLSRFVTDPFTPTAKFDDSRFSVVVQKAQRLMDDMIDLELEAIDRIRQKIWDDPEPLHIKKIELDLWERVRYKAQNARRTGLGVTALGDMLAMLGVKYGSPESLDIAESAYRSLALNAYRSTVKMAEERGAFPDFNFSEEEEHPFIERILDLDPDLRANYENFGRRNIALTTTAPAGSVSILTQTTSGCEPVFQAAYTRRKKVNPNDLQARIDFIDALGDRWQHFEVLHHGLQQWKSVTGNSDITKSPYHGAQANEIDWNSRVDLQARAQKWVCHSISSTINLPKETTKETVSELYMRGWLSGCKGLTIYRDGCRDGVLVTKSETEPQTVNGRPTSIIETHAPVRPKSLQCDIHHATVRGDKYVVIVGLLHGRPYEVFAGLSQQIEIPKKIKGGTLVKNGKNESGLSTYRLEVSLGDDEVLAFRDIVTLFDNPLYGALTRMVSMSLRHGCPVEHLVEQLKKDKHADITSFSSVIARVLAKHYMSDAPITTGEACSVCKSTNLRREQGCISCVDCGASRCG
jgi:ribonucleoside-diphosphate reductase alpha chain